MKRLTAVCTVLVASLAFSLPAMGKEGATFSQEFGKTLPPIGFVKFCAKNMAECQTKADKPQRIPLSSQTWEQIVGVNTLVNSTIRPMSDQDLYGVPELWTFPIDAGDCEDYLLLKKRHLEALGFVSNSLLITVVLDEKGDGHAVLTVATDKGDYVLDNRRNDVLFWNQTGYTFVKRQAQTNARLWVSLAKQKTSLAEQVSSENIAP